MSIEMLKCFFFNTLHLNTNIYLSDRIVVLSDKPTVLLEQVEIPLSRPRVLTSAAAEKISNHISELFGGMIG